MSKKSLPKAIRPNVTQGGGPEPHPRVSEPLPEVTKAANTKQELFNRDKGRRRSCP